MQQHRTVQAHLAGPAVRTEQIQGREHLVTDAVLLVADRVIRPLTGRGVGEFVPSSVLAREPAVWSGTLVTAGHPSVEMSITNNPSAAERLAFGLVRNARFRDGKLVAELVIDPVRAAAVGPDAVDVVERLRKGQMVEVSIGAWVTMRPEQGIAAGGRFELIWEDLLPDHVAALGPEQVGACSGAMGCGIGRPVAAQAAQACVPTAADVLDAIARTQYERECRRVRLAALQSPPPNGYAEGLKKLGRQPLSLSLDSDGSPQPYTSALEALNRR